MITLRKHAKVLKSYREYLCYLAESDEKFIEAPGYPRHGDAVYPAVLSDRVFKNH